MDRRQMLVQRVREYFGDRLDDVLHIVQQDRQELRGWQEPAHVRAAVRRAVREGGREGDSAGRDTTTTATERTNWSELEFGRNAEVLCACEGAEHGRFTVSSLLPHGFAIPPR